LRSIAPASPSRRFLPLIIALRRAGRQPGQAAVFPPQVEPIYTPEEPRRGPDANLQLSILFQNIVVSAGHQDKGITLPLEDDPDAFARIRLPERSPFYPVHLKGSLTAF